MTLLAKEKDPRLNLQTKTQPPDRVLSQWIASVSNLTWGLGVA